jgi:arylsulfatase A-like enzyme
MFPKGGGLPRLGQPSLWPHADRVYEEAVRLLDAHDRKRPFFLYLHFMDVHQYAAPPPFKKFGTDTKGDYLAAIRWVDDAVGRVRKKIADAGYGPRTLMVFAADHGETFGEHGVHGHARNVLTPVVRVPLVVRFPFAVEPAVRIGVQVRNVDIAPTLLDLAGITVPPNFEGRTLVPLMTESAAERDRPSFAALGVPLFPDASVQTAISDGAWTYARNAIATEDDETAYADRAVAPGAEYLFDRSVDPGENVNLMEHEVSMAVRMRTLLDAHLAEGGAGVVEKGVRIDPGIADRLRAMGYLH